MESEMERMLKERESRNAYVEKLRAERKEKELKDRKREIPQESLEEENGAQDNRFTTSRTPNVNRNLKPSAYPSDGVVVVLKSTEKHQTDLKSLGVRSYMNSIIQCLNCIPALVDYFVTDSWKSHYKQEKRVVHGSVSAEFSSALKEMSYGHRLIILNDIKENVVGLYTYPIGGNEQQNAYEFLILLLDLLHGELNQVPQSPLKEQTNDGLSDTEAADKAWNDYCASHKSIISELICGQWKSTTRCLSCSKETVTFEPFIELSLPIMFENDVKIDIQKCIDLFTAEEFVRWKCVYCKTSAKALRKIDLWRFPNYLIIHLQRGLYNDGWWKMKLTEVDFPVDDLDLTANVKGSSVTHNFRLQAVSNQYGDGNHYTAYCRKNNQWVKFEDDEMTSINPQDVVTPAAHILFYCDSRPC